VGQTDGQTDGRIAASLNTPSPYGGGMINTMMMMMMMMLIMIKMTVMTVFPADVREKSSAPCLAEAEALVTPSLVGGRLTAVSQHLGTDQALARQLTTTRSISKRSPILTYRA